jgi:phospholipid/cholesterol/gamma-HCH transport system ATP-binding protein
MSQTTAPVELENLWSVFGDQLVHQEISLSVGRGESLALVGGSGSGKTTLLRHMLGLEKPMRGTVRLFGQSLQDIEPQEVAALRKRCGVLFQEGGLFSALTVFDNIALPLRELGYLDEGTIRDLVMLKLEMVEIEAWHAHKIPAELSGGLIKRVGLARALVLEPELLFLDEPTAGLDPDRSESLVTLIENLRREANLTIVMVTQDLDTLVALSDRVAVLADQRIVALGPFNEVVHLDHPFTCNFFAGRRGAARPV